MTTLQSRLEDIDARLANAQSRLSEAEKELSNLQQLGHPTRAVETGLALMAETMDAMVAVRHLLIRNVLSQAQPMVDHAFLHDQAAHCRELAASAIKLSIRKGLNEIADELERAASADPNLSSSA
jgi:hypothetical protein